MERMESCATSEAHLVSDGKGAQVATCCAQEHQVLLPFGPTHAAL